MANEEHLKILKQGVEVWNRWREDNPKVTPDLTGADLIEMDLGYADLRKGNLEGADLTRAHLRGADFRKASLKKAKLIGAKLRYANLKKAILIGAHISRADLTGSDLREATITQADLRSADLKETKLVNANLSGANLTGAKLVDADLVASYLFRGKLLGANLTGAKCRGAKLRYANLTKAILINTNLSAAELADAQLTGADLTDADLTDANLTAAKLAGADFTKTICWGTLFADNDLSEAKGLDTVRHTGPSKVTISTFYKSAGRIPETFLRGCGVPHDFIVFIPSLFTYQQAIQFYSCFISYSTKDEEFARRLYSRMRDEKLRVWFAPEDVKGGEKLHEQLERAIQLHDRLLLVLSDHSMQSEWVMTEIRKARKAEVKEKRRKLFPIRLVDFDTIREWECFDADTGKDLAVEVREYFIPDFSNWKDHDSFEAAFARLLRDLRAEEGHA